MKKVLALLLTLILAVSLTCGFAAGEEELTKIIVGASPTPHAEILAEIAAPLAEMGYELEIMEFTDYIQPNLALDNGELSANYFQHKPYLDDFNEKNGTDLIEAVFVHYEPFGIYPGKTASLDELEDGAQIAVPNDPTNEARALLLLEAEGLITLNEDAGLDATIRDIEDNPKNLDIIEIEAAQLARSLPDVDLAVINGNYAIQAGLNASTDAIAIEAKDSLAAETFANVIAVKTEDLESDLTFALVEAIQSDAVREFIDEKYEGAVIAMF